MVSRLLPSLLVFLVFLVVCVLVVTSWKNTAPSSGPAYNFLSVRKVFFWVHLPGHGPRIFSGLSFCCPSPSPAPCPSPQRSPGTAVREASISGWGCYFFGWARRGSIGILNQMLIGLLQQRSKPCRSPHLVSSWPILSREGVHIMT